MTASRTPVNITIGSQAIDKSVVPYISVSPIYSTTYDLKPGAIAQYWIDNIYMTAFVQPASIVTVNSGFNANAFVAQEGIYCPNTHAYAIVQQTSQQQTLQIAENFACINLNVYGSNTFAAAQYTANDVVYQANNTANVYANTMLGRVAYWDSANGALAIIIEQGSINNVSTTNVLFKVGSTKLANVKNLVIGNKFPSGQVVFSVANTSKFFLANTYAPNHGLITQSNTGTLIQVSGLSPNTNVVGNSIYLVRGSGVGQTANIIAWNSGTGYLTLDTSWSTSVAGNTYYGIGNNYVDAIGTLCGIIHIPEDPNFNFQSGSRLVTINDSITSATDNNASMRSTATFVAAGQLPIGTAVTPVVSTTPSLSPAANSTIAPSSPTSSSISNNGPINNPAVLADPLVQTFFTPKSNTNGTDYGCFATSVNIFFQNVPTGNSTQFPVSVYLVTTVNGYPTANILATSSMRYESINYSDGINTFPSSANSSTYTNFAFVDPVYLAPGEEYGIVVYSESPDYRVWVSESGETVINNTQLVSKSPYIGSFYEAQNSSAWNAIPNQQLMFVLNKAAFSTTPVSLVFNVKQPVQNVYMDMVSLHSADLTFPVANISYGIQATTANNSVTDTAFKPVQIDVPFYYGGDLSNSSINSNRRRLIQEGNANSCLIQATLTTSNPDVSPFFHSEALNLISFANIINPGGIDENSISITNGGNHINAANIVVTFSAPTGDGGITATGNVIAANLVANLITAITVVNPGAGYVTAPTITITEPSAPANATAVVTGENSNSGGNDYVRYMTRAITLANGFDSGDLVVFLQAIRPQGTDISVYYKVLSAADSQPISNVSWQLMSKLVDSFSPDQQTPINLTYNTGINALGVPVGSVAYVQNGITYPLGGTFHTFQIKITLTANDPTVPPEVQNFRCIAVPAG